MVGGVDRVLGLDEWIIGFWTIERIESGRHFNINIFLLALRSQ